MVGRLPRRFFAESLENRRLFAVTLTNGVLAIDGTDAGDTISVTSRATTVTVRVNADRTTYNFADVDAVTINGLGGDDKISLGNRLDVPALIDGGGSDDRITGGRADDVITGGDGNDRISGGAGDDQLFGGAGSDRLLGGDGDDDLSGGAGPDVLAGGAGFDTADANDDLRSGVEDPASDLSRFPVFSNAGFSPFTPVDTTGFDVQPGTNVISPLLSTAPAGNNEFFDPQLGLIIQSGNAFVLLPGTGAFQRELGASSGNAVQSWFTGNSD
jgi:Ca2+-binding RTX toxin-like protein